MKKFLLSSILFVICIMGVHIGTKILSHVNKMDLLGAYTIDSDAFRAMDFGEGNLDVLEQMATDSGADVYEMITAFMVENEFSLSQTSFHPDMVEFEAQREFLLKKKPVEFKKLKNCYAQILEDLQVFPISMEENSTSWVVYENSWGEERSYGGQRKHEGTDLMAENQLRGYYPVLSMTDGVIEKIGWLEQGGWRIGVKSPNGVYFYYAHLSDYFKDYQVGDSIEAGDILGFMGDSGDRRLTLKSQQPTT